MAKLHVTAELARRIGASATDTRRKLAKLGFKPERTMQTPHRTYRYWSAEALNALLADKQRTNNPPPPEPPPPPAPAPAQPAAEVQAQPEGQVPNWMWVIHTNLHALRQEAAQASRLSVVERRMELVHRSQVDTEEKLRRIAQQLESLARGVDMVLEALTAPAQPARTETARLENGHG